MLLRLLKAVAIKMICMLVEQWQKYAYINKYVYAYICTYIGMYLCVYKNTSSCNCLPSFSWGGCLQQIVTVVIHMKQIYPQTYIQIYTYIHNAYFIYISSCFAATRPPAHLLVNYAHFNISHHFFPTLKASQTPCICACSF